MATIPDHHALYAWLAQHHGVVGRTQLHEFGFSDSAIQNVTQSGRLVRIMPSVYRSPSHLNTPLQTMAAVCLRYDYAHVTATSAAGPLMGLRKMQDPRIHVLIPHAQRSADDLRGVVFHRSRRIDPVDVVDRRRDGIRHTSPARALLDAADMVGAESLESAIEHALRKRLCTLPDLLRAAERLHHPRRPGSTRFREVVMSRPAWRKSARSDLEVRFLRGIEDQGLPQPLVNNYLELASGDEIEVDLLWRDQMVIGEVDHTFWHEGRAPRQRDRQRDRRTAALGWLTVRFEEEDIDLRFHASLGELRDVLITRGWTGSTAA